MRFAIVGPGKVGTAMARLLAGAGHAFVGAAGRRTESARAACERVGGGIATTNARDVTAEADLVLITTPDDAIHGACDDMSEAGGVRPGSVVAHCSGVHPSDILRSARAAGAHVGSLHPLQTLATVEAAIEALPGSYCCIEGDAKAVAVLERIARDLRLHAVTIPTEAKAAYHAACCMCSNYLVALENAAARLMQAAGMPRDDALQALLPLVRATVSNLEKVGIPDCLTGPIARGDVATVRLHLDAIGECAPGLLPLYRTLGSETILVARAKGTLDAGRARQMAALLDADAPSDV